IGADVLDDLTGEAELLVDLAEHGLVGRLVRLEEPGDERVPRFRVTVAAHQKHAAVALDDRGHHRDRIVPVHEAAAVARTNEPQTAAALGLTERRAAFRAELEVAEAHPAASIGRSSKQEK